MSESLGAIRGQIRIDAKQAIAEYSAVRAANATTRASLLAGSRAFARAGVGMLAAAAPIAYFFKKAVDAAATFQKKLDYFGAVTNATKADMDAVAKKAIEMSKTTVYSANQMADAFVEFGKAGISTKDILGGVAQATANLAQAADLNIAEASNTVVAAMKTFSIGAGGAGHIADVLAGAANASIIDVTDLATSLKYAGGIAAATKVPFESVVTAIALLGNAGIRGSTAGTSLRQIMISLTSQTPRATKVLKELGIITKDNTNLFIDQAGHIKPLSDIFQILQDHTRGLTDAQRLAATKVIFNSRALAAANILLHDGAKGFAEMNGEISKVSAADVAHKRLDNLAGDITHLKNTIQTFLIQAGGPLQGVLRMVVKSLILMIKVFTSLPKGVQKAIFMFLVIGGILLLIGGTLSLFIALVLRTIVAFSDLWKAAKLVGRAFQLIGVAFRALSVLVLTNPLALLIVAIVAVVAILVYCWFHFKSFRDNVKKALKAVASAAVAFWHALVSAFHAVTDAAIAVWHAVTKAWDKIVHVFQTAGKAIGKAIETTIKFVKEHWKAILPILAFMVAGPIGLAMALVVDIITTHWNWIKSHIIAVVKAIAGFLTAAWNDIKNVVLAVWNAIVAVFVFIWNLIKTVITTAVNAIKAVLDAIWGVIGGTVRAVWNSILTFITTVWHLIYTVISTILHAILAVVTAIFNAILSAGRAIFNGLWSAISGTFNRIWHLLSTIMGKVLSYFAGAGSWLYNAGKAIVEGLWHGISGAVGWLGGKIKGFAGGVISKVTGFLGIHSPSRLTAEAGKYLVQGLAKGIDDNRKVSVKAAQHMSNAVIDAVNVNAQYAAVAAASVPNRAAIASVSKPQVYSGKSSNASSGDSSVPTKQVHNEIHHLEVKNPKPERATDSLYHELQLITEVGF